MISPINFTPKTIPELIQRGGREIKTQENNVKRFVLNQKTESGINYTSIYETLGNSDKLFRIPTQIRATKITKGKKNGKKFITRITLDTSINGNEKLTKSTRFYTQNNNLDKVIKTTQNKHVKNGLTATLDHEPNFHNTENFSNKPITTNYEESPIPNIETFLNALL